MGIPAATVSPEAFVQAFQRYWAAPKLELLDGILHPDVVLIQPLSRPARGLAEAKRQFARIFALIPDLHAEVDGWSAAGDVVLARDLLGHPFLVEGRVVVGDRRGRELGYPTANMRPGRRGLWPADGIYAVRAAWQGAAGAGWHDGVASLGVRPTFGPGERLLEVHLFDQDVALYGRRLCCAFIERLRPEAHFAAIDDLKAQMARDCAAARAALAATAA